MPTIYRFRSIDKLLCEPFNELAQQTIFFSAPQDLNDPVEGFRDIVWLGDRILWTNLFKHYTYCLCDTVLNVYRRGRDFSLEDYPIQTTRRWGKPPTLQALFPFQSAWTKFRHECQLDKVAERIAAREGGIRRDELLYYLLDLHDGCMKAISETLASTGSPTLSGCRPEALHHRETWLRGDDDFEEDLLTELDFQGIRLQLLRDLSSERSQTIPKLSESVVMLLALDFPSAYVDALSGLLWPPWYVACFTRNPNSISMWSHYADAHTGACLIFDTVQGEASFSLPLTNERESTVVPFHEVQYRDGLNELDFFGAILHWGEDMYRFWYMDEDGQTSERATNGIVEGADLLALQEVRWAEIMRGMSTKTKEWEHERECRLIMFDANAVPGLPSLDYNHRATCYEFCCLTGIIFGIRTSWKDKSRIIDIVNQKCIEHNRTGFQVLQAYYSPQTSDIRSRQVLVLPDKRLRSDS